MLTSQLVHRPGKWKKVDWRGKAVEKKARVFCGLRWWEGEGELAPEPLMAEEWEEGGVGEGRGGSQGI